MKQQRRADIPNFRASGRDRLIRLADFLENVPASMLTFTRWYGDGHGCAVGLAAAQDPWFQAQGLTLAGFGKLKECRPVYDGLSEWPAVAEFFDISIAKALEFFTAGGYGGNVRPPAADIAQKVRAHLAKSKAEAVA
jgi:hypothetical protein